MPLPAFIPALMMGVQLTVPVADPVPSFNVQPSCQAAARGDAGIKQDLQVCLEDEKGARDELAKDWSQFAPSDRSLCTRLAATGGSPTYTELLVCLQMARDARKLSRDSTLESKP